jgi:hypothetical protein
MEKLFIVHVNSGERMDVGEREKGGGGEEGRGKADPAATLTAALVVFLPNEVVVHWGAASPADGSSYSALCAFPLVLLPFFLYLCFCSNSSLFFLFLFCYFFFHFFPFCSSMFLSILSSLSLPYFLSIFHL